MSVEESIQQFIDDLRRAELSSVNCSMILASVVATCHETQTMLPEGVYPAWKELLAFRDKTRSLRSNTTLFAKVREHAQ